MANIVGHLRHVATTAHEQGRSRQLRHAPCSLSAPPLLNLRTFHSALRLLLLSYTLSMLLLSIPQSFAAPLAWQQLSPADPTAPKPSPRRGGALAFDPLGQQLIAFGGIGVEGILQDTWLYDITARSWRQLQHPEGSPVPGGMYRVLEGAGAKHHAHSAAYSTQWTRCPSYPGALVRAPIRGHDNRQTNQRFFLNLT